MNKELLDLIKKIQTQLSAREISSKLTIRAYAEELQLMRNVFELVFFLNVFVQEIPPTGSQFENFFASFTDNEVLVAFVVVDKTVPSFLVAKAVRFNDS